MLRDEHDLVGKAHSVAEFNEQRFRTKAYSLCNNTIFTNLNHT